jgi:hypothetical protein
MGQCNFPFFHKRGPEELKELVQKAGLDIEALKKQAQEKPLASSKKIKALKIMKVFP